MIVESWRDLARLSFGSGGQSAWPHGNGVGRPRHSIHRDQRVLEGSGLGVRRRRSHPFADGVLGRETRLALSTLRLRRRSLRATATRGERRTGLSPSDDFRPHPAPGLSRLGVAVAVMSSAGSTTSVSERTVFALRVDRRGDVSESGSRTTATISPGKKSQESDGRRSDGRRLQGE